MDVQRELRETPGTTVLLYDQVCATEKRRRTKRGTIAAAQTKPFINAAVCEGCGDCSRASNCVSIEPLNTPFGRKRKINQSTCNTDLSCLDGFCPSFITVTGAEPAKTERTMATLTADSTPLPETEPLEGVRNIVFTGIGGTGVTTVASILAMAAHVDGRASSVVDMTGLAQKGGAVFSHVRIGETETTTVGGPRAGGLRQRRDRLRPAGRRRARGAGALRQGPHGRLRQRRLLAHRRVRDQPRRALRHGDDGPPDRPRGEGLQRLPATTWRKRGWATPSSPT
jgi:hypothetical protein